ncbi:hypothetical protein [Tenacibaculum sp. 190524A05c]|uniref:hypothetical protein n=1 Tax=Tenacibaculum platacis TaxID=3137852 RepID=UPI0032B25D1A
MKKIIFSLVMLVGFTLSTMTIQSSFAQDAFDHAENEVGGGGSSSVKCYCADKIINQGGVITNIKICKAGNSGILCAQSTPNGNVQCWKYDQNCQR